MVTGKPYKNTLYFGSSWSYLKNELGDPNFLNIVKTLWDQVIIEWNNFQEDMKTEIRYVEQLHLQRTKSDYRSQT